MRRRSLRSYSHVSPAKSRFGASVLAPLAMLSIAVVQPAVPADPPPRASYPSEQRTSGTGPGRRGLNSACSPLATSTVDPDHLCDDGLICDPSLRICLVANGNRGDQDLAAANANGIFPSHMSLPAIFGLVVAVAALLVCCGAVLVGAAVCGVSGKRRLCPPRAPGKVSTAHEDDGDQGEYQGDHAGGAPLREPVASAGSYSASVTGQSRHLTLQEGPFLATLSTAGSGPTIVATGTMFADFDEVEHVVGATLPTPSPASLQTRDSPFEHSSAPEDPPSMTVRTMPLLGGQDPRIWRGQVSRDTDSATWTPAPMVPKVMPAHLRESGVAKCATRYARIPDHV